MYRKNPGEISSGLKTCSANIVSIFEKINVLLKYFLMSIRSPKQLLQRDIYVDVSCIVITYPIPSKFSKRPSLFLYTSINTGQHESTRFRHESTRFRHKSTRINTSPTQVNTNQYERDTNQHESTRINTSLKQVQITKIE